MLYDRDFSKRWSPQEDSIYQYFPTSLHPNRSEAQTAPDILLLLPCGRIETLKGSNFYFILNDIFENYNQMLWLYFVNKLKLTV